MVGLILVAVVLLIATGRSDGRDGNLIEIYHLYLEDIELTMADSVNPPAALVDQYPAVVAEVNGEPISNSALATRQVMLELGRRQWLEVAADLPEGLYESQLQDIESADPLEDLTNDTLKRQAAERLGLLPSYDEAVAYTEEQEASVVALPALQREASLETLRLQGLPTENWASNARIVEGYRQGMGLAKLQQQECDAMSATPNVQQTTFGYDCSAFLERERERAGIVYYVKWAD